MFDSVGAFLYGTFYIAVGFLFHAQIHQAVRVLNELGLSATLVALVLVAGYIAFRYVRRRARTPRKTVGPVAQPAPCHL
jgi:membrane protein DedA with SNARE-associated domain